MKKKAVIIGGGLWGGLLAYFLTLKRPDIDFVIYEDKGSFGGNHTWSFHGSDVDSEMMELLRPFIRKSWEGYKVSFPSYTKHIPLEYHSISSDLFNQKLLSMIPPEKIHFGTKVSLKEARLEGDIVFDCRGMTPSGNCGFQKFLGLEFRTTTPHALTSPILMDANVDQIDGFRFIYILPFDESTLLIEDTRYSEDSFVDHFRMRENIKSIALSRGWQIKEFIREESGALPIPFEYLHQESEDTMIDLKGIFHDTTGYSLPDAVRILGQIIESNFEFQTIQSVVDKYRKNKEKDRQFFCFLNRMMFHGNDEYERYKTLEFFYNGSLRSIKKFYRGEMNRWDKVFFFLGKPPVEISKAFKVIMDGKNMQKERVL